MTLETAIYFISFITCHGKSADEFTLDFTHRTICGPTPSDYTYVPAFHYCTGNLLHLCWLSAATWFLLLWDPTTSAEIREPIFNGLPRRAATEFFHQCRGSLIVFSQYFNEGSVYWALSWNIVGRWVYKLYTMNLVKHSFFEGVPKLTSSRQCLSTHSPFEAS